MKFWMMRMVFSLSLCVGVILTSEWLRHALGGWSLMVGGGLLGLFGAWTYDRSNKDGDK